MTGLTSHAYIIRDGTLEDALNLVREEGIAAVGNPDVYAVRHDSFGVEEARRVTEYASLAPLGGRKYIAVCFASATVEAQTALLKTVEEGTGRSVFLFAAPTGTPLLPTLVSRCVVLKPKAGSKTLEAAEEFLALGYTERLALAEKFGRDHDWEGARSLVRSLLGVADEKKFGPRALRDLLDADRYLALSGSSPKGVIGHLALIL